MSTTVKRKIINLKVAEDFKYQIKLQAVKEKTTMQDLILRVMREYCQRKEKDEVLIIEHVNEDELTAEEREAIEEGRRDIEEGRTISFDEYMKGRV
jgi:hypothetical protein